MSRFYFFLWLKWAFRVSFSSIALALILSLFITAFIYLKQGTPAFSSDVFNALYDITLFWFPILWSLTLLLSLFRSLKYIFNVCIAEYKLELLSCKLDEVIEYIGYGDLVKVWRKWFMLIIWLVGIQMILSLVLTYFFTAFRGVFEWFNVYWLFVFILSAGYISFILLSSRCKRVKVVKC